MWNGKGRRGRDLGCGYGYENALPSDGSATMGSEALWLRLHCLF